MNHLVHPAERPTFDEWVRRKEQLEQIGPARCDYVGCLEPARWVFEDRAGPWQTQSCDGHEPKMREVYDVGKEWCTIEVRAA